MKGSNTAHSIRQRLLNYAQAHRENFDLVLLRYANERLLYRLGRSAYAERFLLKGATLFLPWNENQPHRPTRDVDLLAVGREDAEQLREVFRILCGMEEADGVVYDSGSVTVAPIREERRYGGQRITLRAELHGDRISLQFDIGFGDAVTPAAEWVEVPVVLAGSDKPRLKAYPVYTVIAEKFEAMMQLGMANSRMKDFYDLDFLLSRFSLDNEILRAAIRNTFARRRTDLPARGTTLFAPRFMKEKSRYWEQFLRRNRMELRNAHGNGFWLLWKLDWVLCSIKRRYFRSTRYHRPPLCIAISRSPAPRSRRSCESHDSSNAARRGSKSRNRECASRNSPTYPDWPRNSPFLIPVTVLSSIWPALV